MGMAVCDQFAIENHLCTCKRRSVLTAIFPGRTWVCQSKNVSILDFVGAKDDGGGGGNWSYKTCKAPVKSSPSTTQRPTFLQARCP